MELTLLSLDCDGVRHFALVPFSVKKFCKSYSFYNRPELYQHWVHFVDVDAAHVRPRKKVKFWDLPLPENSAPALQMTIPKAA